MEEEDEDDAEAGDNGVDESEDFVGDVFFIDNEVRRSVDTALPSSGPIASSKRELMLHATPLSPSSNKAFCSGKRVEYLANLALFNIITLVPSS